MNVRAIWRVDLRAFFYRCGKKSLGRSAHDAINLSVDLRGNLAGEMFECRHKQSQLAVERVSDHPVTATRGLAGGGHPVARYNVLS